MINQFSNRSNETSSVWTNQVVNTINCDHIYLCFELNRGRSFNERGPILTLEIYRSENVFLG